MPQSYYPLEPEKLAVVVLDGLPRVVRYVDEDGATSQHVAYFSNDAQIVQTMLSTDWIRDRGPLPADPTPAESEAAILARQQAAQQAQVEEAQLRQDILTVLRSAQGVPFRDLNITQLKAVVAGLAWESDALNPDTTLRSPERWLRRR